MYKLAILIDKNPEDPNFDAGWPEFLHLAERMPGLRKETTTNIEHVIFGNYPYTFVHELYFDSLQAAQAAMGSDEGRAAGKVLQTLTKGHLTLYFADHREDTAENISRYLDQEIDDQSST
jgi:uncharacterized protein (TIGR02118 family)